MLKGKMIMTFRDNIPQRWLEHPELLPQRSVSSGGFKPLLSNKSHVQNHNQSERDAINSSYERVNCQDNF